MRTLTVTIDRSGCIILPEQVLEALGVHALREVEVTIELTEKAVVIRPKHPVTPITKGIAAMNLPVDEWDLNVRSFRKRKTRLGRGLLEVKR